MLRQLALVHLRASVNILDAGSVAQLEKSQPESIDVLFVLIIVEVEVLLLEVVVDQRTLVDPSLVLNQLLVLDGENLLRIELVLGVIN